MSEDTGGYPRRNREPGGTIPLLSCPRCQSQAYILHVVDVPAVTVGRGRVQFDNNGTPIVRKIPTISAKCIANGHNIAGPVEDYEDASVAFFMAAVDKWNDGLTNGA